MTNTATDNIKSRIRKLLNLASNDAAADGEIENALAAAQRLMDAYQLGEHDIKEDAAQPRRAGMADMTDSKVRMKSSRSAAWEDQLAGLVKLIVGTVGVYRTTDVGTFGSNGKRTRCYVYYGPAEDVAIATSLYDDLHATIGAMAVGRYGTLYQGQGRSYAEGFVSGLRDRIKRERAEMHEQQADRSTALIALRSNSLALANQWLRESKGIRLTSGSRSGGGGRHHHDAYGSGRADGARADATARRSPKLGGGGRFLKA